MHVGHKLEKASVDMACTLEHSSKSRMEVILDWVNRSRARYKTQLAHVRAEFSVAPGSQ